jgi:hypothetical protein
MKKLILILILLFPHRGLGGFLYAQGDFTRIYHPIINEAELAIVDTNYYEALDFYKEAFANVKKPFAKDYYNAAICASMVGKLSLTFDYLEKIVEKGYPSDILRKDVFFHYVADTCKRWDDFEKQMKLVKPNINKELRDTLQKLYALSRKEIYTPLTSELRAFYKENFKEKWRPVDSLVIMGNMSEKLLKQQDSLRKINDKIFSKNNQIVYQKAIQLIETNGFLGENEIGLSSYETIFNPKLGRWNNIESKNYNQFMLNNSLSSSLLSTSFSNGEKDILPTIIQAIRDGKLQPEQINNIITPKFNKTTKTMDDLPIAYRMGKVQVLQLQLESNLICKNAQGIENKKFWKKEHLGDYTEAEINEKRQDIGLEKLADAYKKAFFKANSTPFIINGGNYQKELSYISSCEVLEKMLKESAIIR